MSQRYLSRGFGGLMSVLIAVCVQGTALHADTTPPKGAVTDAIGFPPVGTECEYKIHGVKDVETGQEMPLHLIYRVLEDATHNGRPVHRMRERSSGTILLRDKATGGWIGFALFSPCWRCSFTNLSTSPTIIAGLSWKASWQSSTMSFRICGPSRRSWKPRARRSS